MVTSLCNSFDVFLYFSFSATETKRDYFVLDCLWDHFFAYNYNQYFAYQSTWVTKRAKVSLQKKWSFPLRISLRIWSHLLKKS